MRPVGGEGFSEIAQTLRGLRKVSRLHSMLKSGERLVC